MPKKELRYSTLINIPAITTANIKEMAALIQAIGEYMKSIGNERIQITFKLEFGVKDEDP